VKVERLVVGKGRTTKPSDAEEWLKEYYEMEVAIEDPAELEVAKAELKGLIDGWLSTSKPAAPAAKPATQLSQLDPDELAKLSWKTYKTKQECRSDEAGWIFRNTLGAEALADLIEKQGNGITVQIGPYKFEAKFSGADKQFIGRATVKT
jgi:hypothetical protein